MGKAIRASVLTLLLAGSASAGIMTHGVYDPPPPPPPAEQQQVQEPTVQEETAEDAREVNLFVQIALDLLTLL